VKSPVLGSYANRAPTRASSGVQYNMRALCPAILFLSTFSTAGLAQNTPKAGVEVALSHETPLHLRVTLTSGATTTIRVNRYDLPWGYRYSMVFAAAKPNGEAIALLLPVADPGMKEISVKPGETLTGDVDLQYVIGDLSVLKKSDVLLFWAYKTPAALHLPDWTGGLVVIPQLK
jgi:hypothetical protein